MAPPVTPDRPADSYKGTIEYSTDTGAAIPITGFSQSEIEKMRQLESTIKQKPQLAQSRESLREQLVGQERGFYGVKTYKENEKEITPFEKLDQIYAERKAEKENEKEITPFEKIDQIYAERKAEEASKEIYAGGIIKKFREMPEQFQTPETLKSIAETSRERQINYAPLTVLGNPNITWGDISSTESRAGYFNAAGEAGFKAMGENILKLPKAKEGEYYTIAPVPETSVAASYKVDSKKGLLNFGFTAYEKGKEYLSKANKFVASQPFFIGMAAHAKQSEAFITKIETKYKSTSFSKKGTMLGKEIEGAFKIAKFGEGMRFQTAKEPVSFGAEMGIAYGTGSVFSKGFKLAESTGIGKNVLWKYVNKPVLAYGLGGAYAVSTAKELSTATSPFELGQKSAKPFAQIMGFGLSNKIKVKAKDRPYFYTTRTPTYVKTESGQDVFAGYNTKVNYNRLIQPAYFKTIKLEEFNKFTNIQSGARVIKSGENIFVVRETTRRYVMPRKAKETIPIGFKGEEMTFTGKVEIGGKQYPQFVKTEIKQGYGIIRNPLLKTKVEGDKIFTMLEINQKNVLKEVRIGKKGQKLEPYLFKPKGSKKYIDYDKLNIIPFLESAPSPEIKYIKGLGEGPTGKTTFNLKTKTSIIEVFPDRLARNIKLMGNKLFGGKTKFIRSTKTTETHEVLHSIIGRKGAMFKPTEQNIMQNEMVNYLKSNAPRKIKSNINTEWLKQKFIKTGYKPENVSEEIAAQLYSAYSTNRPLFEKNFPKVTKIFKKNIPETTYKSVTSESYLPENKILKYPFSKELGDTTKAFSKSNLILTSQIKGKPIAIPKELKAKFEGKTKIKKTKINDFRGEPSEQELFKPDTITKLRAQKTVLKQTPIKNKPSFYGGGVITTTKSKTNQEYGLSYYPTQESVNIAAPSFKFGRLSFPSLKVEPILKSEQFTAPSLKLSPINKQDIFPELGIYPIQEIKPKQDVMPKLRVEQIPKQDIIPRGWGGGIPKPPTRTPPFKMPSFDFKFKPQKNSKSPFRILGRKFRGTPSLSTLFTGRGIKLTKKQLYGKSYISPFQVRKI